MNTSRVPLFALLFLCLPLCIGLAFAAAEIPELYRASYQAEAKGDYAGALAKLRRLRKTAGPSYFLALRTGWLAYLAGEYAGAETSYREAIAANPKAIDAKLGLTLVLFAAKKWNDLEAASKHLLTLDGKHPLARARLAAAQYNLGKFAEASQGYRKLAEEYPGELDYQTGLAWALLRLGKLAEARPVFEGVLAVSPDNPSALQGLAAK